MAKRVTIHIVSFMRLSGPGCQRPVLIQMCKAVKSVFTAGRREIHRVALQPLSLLREINPNLVTGDDCTRKVLNRHHFKDLEKSLKKCKNICLTVFKQLLHKHTTVGCWPIYSVSF